MKITRNINSQVSVSPSKVEDYFNSLVPDKPKFTISGKKVPTEGVYFATIRGYVMTIEGESYTLVNGIKGTIHVKVAVDGNIATRVTEFVNEDSPFAFSIRTIAEVSQSDIDKFLKLFPGVENIGSYMEFLHFTSKYPVR